MLKNFTVENFLLYVDLPKLKGWKIIESEDELENNFSFPQVTAESFDQLIELTSSIHSFIKAISVKGNLRRSEVDDMEDEEIENHKHYAKLLKEGLAYANVSYLRLENPPADYMSQEAAGILPPWPGKGCAFQVTCLPHYKSNTQKLNHRQPVIYVLDSPDPNPLNCSDKLTKWPKF